jgi:hypothetical protein
MYLHSLQIKRIQTKQKILLCEKTIYNCLKTKLLYSITSLRGLNEVIMTLHDQELPKQRRLPKKRERTDLLLDGDIWLGNKDILEVTVLLDFLHPPN